MFNSKPFSTRAGLVSKTQRIQIDALNEETKIKLWNVCLKKALHLKSFDKSKYASIWEDFLIQPLPPVLLPRTRRGPSYLEQTEKDILAETIEQYMFSCKWYEFYDFLEFISGLAPLRKSGVKSFEVECNKVLESELSGYRFINGIIAPLTNSSEMNSIENAISDSPDSVAAHLDTSLKYLSAKRTPDCRNSIKESISAVEAMCRQISGNEKVTLGQCLKSLNKDDNIHPAFRDALSKLYGWTSDESGIRHSLQGENNLGLADAKFMLVICSAFINYLKEKTLP